MLGPEGCRRRSHSGDRRAVRRLTSEDRRRLSSKPFASSHRSRRVAQPGRGSACGHPPKNRQVRATAICPVSYIKGLATTLPFDGRGADGFIPSKFASLNHKASDFQPSTEIRPSITQLSSCRPLSAPAEKCVDRQLGYESAPPSGSVESFSHIGAPPGHFITHLGET